MLIGLHVLRKSGSKYSLFAHINWFIVILSYMFLVNVEVFLRQSFSFLLVYHPVSWFLGLADWIINAVIRFSRVSFALLFNWGMNLNLVLVLDKLMLSQILENVPRWLKLELRLLIIITIYKGGISWSPSFFYFFTSFDILLIQ